MAIQEYSMNSVEATPEMKFKIYNADEGNTTDNVQFDFSHVGPGNATKKKSREIYVKDFMDPTTTNNVSGNTCVETTRE